MFFIRMRVRDPSKDRGNELGAEPFAVVDEQARYGRQLSGESHDYVDMAWQAVLRMLDNPDPSFRD